MPSPYDRLLFVADTITTPENYRVLLVRVNHLTKLTSGPHSCHILTTPAANFPISTIFTPRTRSQLLSGFDWTLRYTHLPRFDPPSGTIERDRRQFDIYLASALLGDGAGFTALPCCSPPSNDALIASRCPALSPLRSLGTHDHHGYTGEKHGREESRRPREKAQRPHAR